MMSSKAQRREGNNPRLHKCGQKSSGTVAHPSSNSFETARGDAGSTGQGGISTPAYAAILPPHRSPDGKRKREVSDSGTHSEASGPNQPASSTTLSRAPSDTPPASPPTKRESSRTPASARKNSLLAQDQPDDTCGICTGRPERRTWESKMGGESVWWVRCEMKTCRLWFHSSCVMVLLHQDPQSMLFCPGPSNDRALLICPACTGQPQEGFDMAIHQAMKAFISTYDTEKRKEVERTLSTECPTHILPVLDGIDFLPVREERYNGLDAELVRNIMRNLHQSVFDYDIEIQNMVDHSAANSVIPPRTPLANWELVDPNSSVILGKQWFNIDDSGRSRARRHASVTAALRTILGTPDGDPLIIPSTLSKLTHSQVHLGLVSWFAFDIIDNQFDIYGMTTMRPVKAMMTAVAAAGEARWPGKGRQHLQEIQLRTWYKSDFQPKLLSNDDRFKRKFEAFLQPLTKDLKKLSSWSDARRNVVEIAFRLWAYLQSLQGRVTMIQPAIGDTFNPNLHEAYDQQDFQLDLRSSLKRKILWILCRGFQYEDDDEGDFTNMITIKARVIVQ